MSLLHWYSFPVWLVAACTAMEAAARVFRAPRARRWLLPLQWVARPWAIWAVFNIIYRAFAAHGFNNRRTFPFYFNLWHERETWSEAARRLLGSGPLWFWSAVLLPLAVLFLLTVRRLARPSLSRGRAAVFLLWLLLLAFALPLAYDCLPDGTGDPLQNRGSFLNAWHDAGNTMLYCMPLVKNKSHFLRHFEKLQPELIRFIHAGDHPPGATLAPFWLGRLLGAREDIRADVVRYALGTVGFSALSVFAMFFLGRSIFSSTRVGLLSAALWIARPASLVYNIFAPDSICMVFYILCLALIWRVTVANKTPVMEMLGLGVVLAVLSMLNFNWPLLWVIFTVFLGLRSRQVGWPAAELLVRGIVPSAVTAALLGWTCWHYRLNYFAIFSYAAKRFEFYDLRSPYQWIMALIGGQLDLWLMGGAFTAYVFWRCLLRQLRHRPPPLQAIFALVILAVYMLPTLISDSLKLETSRVWAWVTAVPLVMTVRELQSLTEAEFYLPLAAALSLLQYYGMRLFLVSAG